MKTKNLLLVVCIYAGCVLCNDLVAQTTQLYGLTSQGGVNNNGTIVKMNPDGTGFTKVYDFAAATGSYPVGNLLQGKDGKLYGNCNLGGYDSSCVLFSFDPATGTYDSLFNYAEHTGDVPYSGLIQLPDGRLCGASSSGGTYGCGVIYSFDPVSRVYSDLYAFGDSASVMNTDSASSPFGVPMLGGDGKLYGLTGGILRDLVSAPYFNAGNLYSFDITTGVYTDLHDFEVIKDGFGYGSLIQLDNGLIYGVTSGNPGYIFIYTEYGGFFFNPIPGNYGNIFSFDPATNTYTDLHDFDSINGAFPFGTLMYGSDGKLYGTTGGGGALNNGTLFSFDPVAKTFVHLFDFDNTTTGVHPSGDLFQSTDGNLYGSTYSGGVNGYGTFFQFNPKTKDFNLVASLDNINGANPMGGGFTLYQSTTGIPSIENTVGLSAYPVPANNYVTLQLKLPANAKAAMNLYDEAGNNVWTSQQELPSGASNTSIDVSCLATGIYILNVNVNGENMTGKVVVQ